MLASLVHVKTRVDRLEGRGDVAVSVGVDCTSVFLLVDQSLLAHVPSPAVAEPLIVMTSFLVGCCGCMTMALCDSGASLCDLRSGVLLWQRLTCAFELPIFLRYLNLN